MKDAVPCAMTKTTCRFKRLGGFLAVCLLIVGSLYNLRLVHESQKNLVQLQNQFAHHNQKLAQLQQQLNAQQITVSELQTIDQNWILKESEYLVNLAQIRIHFLQDVPAALSQLIAAEQRLSRLNDPKLLAVRQQLAHDIGALRAHHAVDVQGIWLRLNALKDGMETLPLIVTADTASKTDAEVSAVNADQTMAAWRRTLVQSWQEIKSMVKIRHHDGAMLTPILGIMDRQRLQQTVLSLVEQAKWAVLNRNTMIYRQSLETLLQGLPLFLGITDQQLSSLAAEIRSLQQIDIAPPVPALTVTFTQSEVSSAQDIAR